MIDAWNTALALLSLLPLVVLMAVLAMIENGERK